ncbi:family 78 glycoside hydrolase catalytic domain [Curtobacterium sp. MCBD17_040]|uniref:family 78 glycoside hydrolase catalytic domain n=1 Tax=Curtobacterium sp. MCBD17_040 TaxID=2175674 RepID=UPI0024DFCC78|nr:family 78 glycoside hydrolase catalytic domain [Curtobacterium sp. MCBD17_040]WIB63522.1 family 78 glycoside hydrolase catalytic domain [Curtobacterium sp. MCBD17_040]
MRTRSRHARRRPHRSTSGGRGPHHRLPRLVAALLVVTALTAAGTGISTVALADPGAPTGGVTSSPTAVPTGVPSADPGSAGGGTASGGPADGGPTDAPNPTTAPTDVPTTTPTRTPTTPTDGATPGPGPVTDPSPTPAAPTGLTVDGLSAPMDVDPSVPVRFSWQPAVLDRAAAGLPAGAPDQRSYRIVVAGSSAAAAAGFGDIWDSGVVTSGASQNVSYAGPTLTAGSRSWFSVQVVDGAGATSPWATPATFGTALGGDWGGARAIWSETPSNTWSNYTLSGHFTITASAATVLLRGTDASDYYLWQFQAASDRLVAEVRRAGAYRVLGTVDLHAEGVDLAVGRDTAFTVSLGGDTITTTIGGTTVDTRTDGTFASGWIGVQTGTHESATFRSLAVADRTGATLWSQSSSSTVADLGCGRESHGVLTVSTSRSCLFDPWSNYTFTETYVATAQPTGVVFRAKDAKNGYLWQFDTATSSLVPQVQVAGKYSKLTTKKIPLGTKVTSGHAYAIKVQVSGSTIRTWFAGRLVDTRTSHTDTRGVIGYRNGSKEKTTFSGLTVTSPGSSVLYRNTFTSNADVPCGTVSGGKATFPTSAACLIRSGAVSDWLFARDEVTLPARTIAWATLSATATSPAPSRQYVYKISVNGSFVGAGPTQSVGKEVRYDSYDVTSLLHAGATNAIGALLYTTSDHRFLAELVVHYTDGTETRVGTGPTWRVRTGTGVFPAAGSVGTSYYAAPVEDIDARQYPSGFDTVGFDDHAWTLAQARSAFATSTLTPTPTATMVQEDDAPTTITRLGTGHYLLDFGQTRIGGLRLAMTSPDTRTVDIRYGEVLASGGGSVQYQTTAGNKWEDRWTLKTGSQTLRSWGIRVFRYVEVSNVPQAVTAHDLQAEVLRYPIDATAATFSSSSSKLDAVWQLSRNTIIDDTLDLYVDSWERERGAYEADAYIEQTAQEALSADGALGTYSVDYLLAHPTWPTEWRLYDVLAVHDAWEASGDTTQIRADYAALRTIPLTGSISHATGLVDHADADDIVDWPAGERDGYQLTDTDTVVNALTYRDLVDLAEMAAAIGKTADAANYRTQAASLRTAINARLWDGTNGAYRDGLTTGTNKPIAHDAVQATAFALAFGVVDPANVPRAASYVTGKGMACSVYCAAFLLPGLYSAGAGSAADALLTATDKTSWMNMVRVGAGSTMEAWDKSLKANTTYSHPWAASPVSDVTTGLFGIVPTAPGYASFSVAPQPGAVDHASVTEPTVRGTIAAAYQQRSGGAVDLALRVPSTTTSAVTLPVGAGSGTTVWVDGVATTATRSGSALVVSGLPSGCHLVSTVSATSAGSDATLAGLC